MRNHKLFFSKNFEEKRNLDSENLRLHFWVNLKDVDHFLLAGGLPGENWKRKYAYNFGLLLFLEHEDADLWIAVTVGWKCKLFSFFYWNWVPLLQEYYSTKSLLFHSLRKGCWRQFEGFFLYCWHGKLYLVTSDFKSHFNY